MIKLNKARITIRQSKNSERVYTMMNGKNTAVIGNSDIERHGDLVGYARYLKSIGCVYTADKINACIRLN
jgi:hypothetical protein